FPTLGIPKENFVIISGIGCSSRFPYYMDTFGMHSIHGRATAIASGLKASRPELSVWVVTGDGDSLSIGGNHLIHLLRRNINIQILLFNNQIYGLTKGQYSPTSEVQKVTKSTPFGSIDNPFNPVALALGSEGTFIARTMDRDPKHMQEMLKRAHQHQGTSFLEIYQNCNIFNDGAFEIFSEKSSKADHTIYLEHGKPLIFGADKNKGILLDGLQPKIVTIGEQYSENDLWIHDETDSTKAFLLAKMFGHNEDANFFPRPFGVIYAINRPCYDTMLQEQLETVKNEKGAGDLDALIAGKETWTIL
ncbi:MAG: 2-oxoacid:ferredoxin oxidoreductase subunit beta, partial [Chitinophagaceae bacterium]|nr:2-oxoacid:ferredoxin oxidoreductase subunit beta [Chitinophagaceae bacterium]